MTVDVLFSSVVGGVYMRLSAARWALCMTHTVNHCREYTGNCVMTGSVSRNAPPDRWKTARTNTTVSDVSESALKVCVNSRHDFNSCLGN